MVQAILTIAGIATMVSLLAWAAENGGADEGPEDDYKKK